MTIIDWIIFFVLGCALLAVGRWFMLDQVTEVLLMLHKQNEALLNKQDEQIALLKEIRDKQN